MVRTLDRFRDIIANHHEYAKTWKRNTGRKVIGYLCTYVPEEIVYAANILPIRVLDSETPSSTTDIHMSPNKWCPCSRAWLSEALQGKYDYLDGIVIAACCFHALQAFGSWRRHLNTNYSHYLYMPANIQSLGAKECLEEELREFKHSLENWTGEVISASDLDESISVYNKNRTLLKKLYELRRSEPPLISGREATEVVLSSQLMDKSEHNDLLKEAIKELPVDSTRIKPNVRLMVISSGGNDTELLGAIESWGANIVVDDQCIGSRYFWNEVVPEEDLLSAIADRYIQRPPCAGKDFPVRGRLTHLLGLVHDYNVHGVIILLYKFCEPHSYDIPTIQAELTKYNVPSIVLEISTPLIIGQIQNRVESFLEVIKSKGWDF